jgi:glycosyltransferase involved in cell wall biosynthesis
LRILILQDYLRNGGTERQSIRLAQGFHSRGHGVSLVTFRPGGSLSATVGAVGQRALQRKDTGWDWFAPGLRRTVRREAADVVLAMGRMANCHLGLLVESIHRRAGRPGIALATFRTGKPIPWLYRRSVRRADQVIANSQEAAVGLAGRLGLAPAKVSVIHNPLVFAGGVAPDRRVEIRAKVRVEQGAGPRTTVLLCVAMFRPEKNQRELVEIAAGLPEGSDWQLWLAGDGPARAACAARSRELGLAERVRFLGFQSEPGALYAAADVAVHASQSEALSNFLIEAQAAGVPVVAYDAQGIGECVVPGHTGWVIPRDDRTAFRAAVTRLASLPEATRAELAAEAERFARARFDPDQQIDAHLELFARVAARQQISH